MRRLLCLPLLATLACAAEGTGTADLALTGQAPSGHVFRLRDGVLTLDGEGATQTFRTEDDPARTSITARLRPGAYQLALAPGWRLEQVMPGGAVPVAAELISSNPQVVAIEDGAVSRVRLRFLADGEDVPMGGGDLDIGVDVEERRAIHVAVTGDDAGAGTADQPMRHVRAAIERAAACGCEVRIAEGVYAEAIVLASGVSIVGGYRGDFAERDPRRHPVVLTSSSSTAVQAVGLSAATRLEDVTVRGADQSADGTGATSVAIRVAASGSWLQLRGVRIEAGRGGRGRDGDDGALTSCTAVGGAGGTAFDCGTAPGGAGTAGGDLPSLGTGGAGGVSYCTNACPAVGGEGVTAGVDGSGGDHGADGGPGVAATDRDGAFTGDVWLGAGGTAGERGAHGTGGGGGGAGGTKRFRACFGCPSLIGGRGGVGAPGGCGGGRGVPGGAGGGAFGIVIDGSRVVAERVEIVGGAGGPGGVGGDGHLGAAGGLDGDVGREDAPSQRCGPIAYQGGAGGRGGAGGHGGRGGGGAGGVGGPAIGAALVGGGALDEAGGVTFAPGTAGVGGRGGAGLVTADGGLAGRSADVAVY